MKQASLFFALWAMLLTAHCRAQTDAPIPSGPPDVLALVYQRPGMGDEVNITYPHRVPHTQAQRDLAALESAAGWTPGPVRITDAAPPVQGRGRIGAMTSASLIVPNVVQDETHAFPLEAFIRAFRAYKRVTLVFFVGSGFQFQGVKQFADNDVQIALEQHGSAYTYQIRILNPQFDHLSLPQSGPTAGAATEPGAKRRSPLILFLGILGLAALTGLLVYLAAARLAKSPGQAEAPPDTTVDETTDEKTEIGTKG